MDSVKTPTPLYHYDVSVSVEYAEPAHRLGGSAQTTIVESLDKILDIILHADNPVLSDEELQKKTSSEVVDYMVDNPNTFFKRTPIYNNNEASIRLTPDESRIHAVLAPPFLRDPFMNKWSLARGFLWVIQKTFPEIANEQLEKLKREQAQRVTRSVGNAMLKSWEVDIKEQIRLSFKEVVENSSDMTMSSSKGARP